MMVRAVCIHLHGLRNSTQQITSLVIHRLVFRYGMSQKLRLNIIENWRDTIKRNVIPSYTDNRLVSS